MFESDELHTPDGHIYRTHVLKQLLNIFNENKNGKKQKLVFRSLRLYNGTFDVPMFKTIYEAVREPIVKLTMSSLCMCDHIRNECFCFPVLKGNRFKRNGHRVWILIKICVICQLVDKSNQLIVLVLNIAYDLLSLIKYAFCSLCFSFHALLFYV